MEQLKRIDIEVSISEVPTNPVDFLDFWKDQIAEIPEEFKASAYLDFESDDDGYGGYSISIDFYYRRPEYPNEITEREAKVLERDARIRDRDLTQLARLKEKYPEVKDV